MEKIHPDGTDDIAQAGNQTDGTIHDESPILTLIGTGSEHGKPFRRSVVFDFGELKVRRGGLLEQAIKSQPSGEIRYNQALEVQMLMQFCKKQSVLRAILSTPTGLLATEDIHKLLSEVEALIQKKLFKTGRCNYPYRPSMQFRQFLAKIKEPFLDGHTLTTMRRHKSRFPSKRPDSAPRDNISESFDPGESNPKYAGPVSALPIDGMAKPEDAAAAVLDHMEHRNQRIINASWADIDAALEWRDRISKLKDAPLPAEILNGFATALEVRTRPCTGHYKSLSPGDRLHLFAQVTREAGLHEFNKMQKWLDDLAEKAKTTTGSTKQAFTGFKAILDAYPQIQKHALGWRNDSYTLLLIDYFLPNRVIVCIRNIFQLRFTLNVETANSLTKACIHKVEDGYELHPLKGKTDQFQPKHIGKDEPDMIRLIELLLQNEENIDRYWRRDSDSVFIGWQCGKLAMGRFDTGYQLDGFIRDHELPHFSPDQLRTQSGNSDFLTFHDPHRTQAIMGHRYLAITSGYLNQGINRTLAELNVQQFMHALAPSIVWVVEGESALAKHGWDLSVVNKKLLFPLCIPANVISYSGGR